MAKRTGKKNIHKINTRKASKVKEGYYTAEKREKIPMLKLSSTEAFLYHALSEAYKRHCDIFREEPDRIADIAIADTAAETAEEAGVVISFAEVLEFYRRMEGVLRKRYKEETKR